MLVSFYYKEYTYASFDSTRSYWYNIRDWALTLLWWSQQTCTLTPLWKTTESPWRWKVKGWKYERKEEISRERTKTEDLCETHGKHHLFTALTCHGCCDICPRNVTAADEIHCGRSYRPRIDVFLLLAFLFRIQNLYSKTAKQEISFWNKYT